MTVQTLLAWIGLALQAQKGTEAANPTFASGISGGPILTNNIEHEVSPATSGKRFHTAADRVGVANGVEAELPAYEEMIGLILYAAMGAIATTGAEAPYAHAITTGDELPWLTVFRKYGGDGKLTGVKDVKLGELKLAWDGPKPLEVSIGGVGCDFFIPPTFVPGTDETGSADYFTPVGGSLKVDVVGGDAAEANIIKGEISVDNGVEGEPISTGVQNAIVSEAVQESEIALTVVPDDLDYFYECLFGAAAGTDVSEVIVIGSFDLTFKCGTATLQVLGENVPFIIEHPDGEPDGGRAELELAGIVLGDDSDVALKFILTNDVADYTP